VLLIGVTMLAFRGSNAEAYEFYMGRWSCLLSAPFVNFARIAGTGRILDVGCGTGSLISALTAAAPHAEKTGIDLSHSYIDFARSRAADPRWTFRQGDGGALPYEDATFDAVLSLLVLNFISDAEKAAGEMVRVAKPNGVVAASVWDFRGGLCHLRMLGDTAAVLDPAGQVLRDKVFSSPFTRPGELAEMWKTAGLRDVDQTSLAIRMEFQSFADYWEPWLGGQGTFGPYVMGLEDKKRALLERHLRLAYLAGGDDGPRSFAATAWAVRGVR
jgi:ubiquinone/menaquinone biosynthesis C-methylase UbiE